MITVRTPKDRLFNYIGCERLYNQCRNSLEDNSDFKDITEKTIFYSFSISSTDELIGCIYFYDKGGKLYVNAFAKRGHHELNLECLKESLKWFDGGIYAEGLHRASRLCLLKCGFKRVKENLFIYRKE